MAGAKLVAVAGHDCQRANLQTAKRLFVAASRPVTLSFILPVTREPEAEPEPRPEPFSVTFDADGPLGINWHFSRGGFIETIDAGSQAAAHKLMVGAELVLAPCLCRAAKTLRRRWGACC